MSVNIVTPPHQSPSLLQRVLGNEPRTVVREASTTTITHEAGGRFDLRTALRNGGIGAAVAGALGGVSLLGKVALPFIGKVASVSGLVRLAGVGGAIGLATAALPLVMPSIRNSPAAKAAVTGAGIGAAAGAVLPLLPVWLGAAAGAGIGLALHARRNRPPAHYPTYPGYVAYPGWTPMGSMPPGAMYGSPGFGYGGFGGIAPPFTYPGHGAGAYGPWGGIAAGIPGATYAPGYGPSMLAMRPGMSQAPMMAQAPGMAAMPAMAPAVATAQPVIAPTAGRAASRGRHPNARTWTDPAGNLRQVGSGRVLRPAAGAGAPMVMPGAAAAAPAMAPYGAAMSGVGMVGAGTPAPLGIPPMPRV